MIFFVLHIFAGSTEPTMPVNDSEEEEGSGAEPQIIDSSSTRPGIVSRVSYITVNIYKNKLCYQFI